MLLLVAPAGAAPASTGTSQMTAVPSTAVANRTRQPPIARLLASTPEPDHPMESRRVPREAEIGR